ncbi:hypothetical protein HMI54_006086 [Coelomomyces lativittatus]|nr:hypothetical protein HMI56_002804 [Coelomomyces lativittatus]KAJ1517315.1 hypothetical protein HMI54_006086 [Coelomomyces lativittatus]
MVIYQKGDTRGIVPSPLLSFLKSNPEINYVQWTTLNETYPFTLGTMDLWEPTDIWKQRVCEVSQSILTTLSFSTSVNCSQLTPWVRLFQAFSSSKDVIGAKVSPRVSLVMKLLSSMTCHPQYCATSTPCVCIQPHLHEAVGPGLKFKAEQWAIQDPSLPHWVQSDWATIGIRSGFYMFKTSKQLEEFFIGLAISIITFLVVWKISVHVK